MQALANRSRRHRAKNRLAAASLPVLEQVEARIFMSTTLAAWNFNNDSGTVLTSPAPSSGAGTAYSVGMESPSSDGYKYPAVGSAATIDASGILAGTGSSDSGGNGGSEDGTTGNIWRVQSGQSQAAAIASQGAQFNVPTGGATGISFSFDLAPSSTGAEAQFAVEYTTDVQDSTPTWSNVTNLLTFGANNAGDNPPASTPTIGSSSTNSVWLQSNPSGAGNNPNIITGTYATITGPIPSGTNTSWLNDLSVDLSGTTAVNNSANFAFRVVNAATGTAETAISGASTFKNWRFDDVAVNAATAGTAPPSVTTQPVNVTAAAGQSVSFTAAASGNPTPTVQWQVATPLVPNSTTGGYSAFTNISGATSATLTFTTSSTAADNDNEYQAVFTNTTSPFTATTTTATLSDPLAAVSITAQPTAVSVTSGNTATFTASASGSPVPTVQWQSNTVSGAANDPNWQNISGATSTTYSFTTATNQNNTFYRAVFTNSQSPSGVPTPSAKLSVAGVTIAAWAFPAVVTAPDNTPAQTSGVAGAGAAQSIGMTNTYAYASTTATNSVTNDDITSVTGTSPATTENVWRVRGHYVATGTAPNIGSPTNSGNVNGWNLNAPSGTQGVEFDVNTTGYQAIQASFDWESTNQGVKNLQEQYNLNTGNATGWTNINSPLTAHAGNYTLANLIDVSAITGANNDPNFGIRMVSIFDPNGAADGLTQVTDANGTHYPYASATSGPYNNSSGNWGFNNVIVTGTQIPAPPAITPTGNPANVTVTAGSPASFTAAATGFPTPTVQWEVATPLQGGGYSAFSNISGATSTTYTIPSTTITQNQNEYEAVFTNTTSPFTANTTFATLTVNSLPTVTVPTAASTVAVGAGSSVTLTSAATGSPTPTVQWEVATPNGSGGFNTPTNITGQTNATYTFTPTESSSGDEYLAAWTNTAGSVASPATTVVVTGTPLAQWNFTSGEAPTPNSTAVGTSNSPYPTLGTPGSALPNPDSATTLGLANNYSSTPSVPEADILAERSVVNSSFNEFVWRVRGGSGLGPTGSPGTPDGWSQLAPQYSQGVQFNVNTTGFSNIALQYDWNQGGIGTYQAQYNSGNGVWTNVGSVIQSTGSDYAGITATTNPTGVLVNLQGVAAANNNPNLEIRLVSAYAPGLPNVVDGNTADPTLHGQYASAGAPSAQNAQQMLTIPDGTSTGTLSFLNGNSTLTTGNISFNADATPSDATTTASNIAAALNALTSGNTSLSGDFSVAPTAQDSSGALYTVTFKGALAHTPESSLITTNLETNLVAVGVQTSGNYTLSVTDSGGTFTTTPLAYNATASQVQNALQALGASGASGFTASAAGDDNLIGSFPLFAVNLAGDSGATLTATSVSGTPLSTPSNLVVTTPVQQWSTGVSTATGVSPFTDGSGSLTIGNINFTGDSANGAPGITSSPPSQTVTATVPVSLTASAYSEAAITGVQWKFSTNGGTNFNPVTGSGAPGSATSGTNVSGTGPGYGSTFTFTPPASQESVSPAYEYEAVFTNANGSISTVPATVTVVAPVAPAITVALHNTSVQAGQTAIFTVSATGSPAPTVQWELFNGSGTFLSNLSNSPAVTITTTTTTGLTSSTLDYTTNANGTEAGDQIKAIFTNAAGSVGANNPATMSVLGAETEFTIWDFANRATSGEAALDNSPAPTTGAGVASMVGMTLPYNPSDPATGTDGFGSYAEGDVTNSPGSLNPNFNENTWRVRGAADQSITITNASLTNNVATLTVSGTVANLPLNSPILVQNVANSAFDGTFTVTAIGTSTISFPDTSADIASATATGQIIAAGVGGTPANGWSNFQPEYSQGVQFSASSEGYNHVYVTMDWYSTTSGELDAQQQYTTDGTNWINLPNGHVQAVSNDFYGATANGGPIPLMFDVSGIPQASNDPNFGVRLVNAYNQVLTTADAANGAVNPKTSGAEAGQYDYANAALVGSPPGPAAYNGSKGNWRFDNIQFHGIPDWLGDTSQAIYNPATNKLTVTGPSTIIGDPETVPTVAINGNLGNIPVDPQIVGSGSAAQLLVEPLVTNSAIHLGGITLSNGAGLDMASVQGVGQGGLNGVERAQGANNVLVLGSADAITQEQLTSNVATLTANNNFYVGDTVQVQGATSAGDGPFDGTFTITAATPTSFSYTVPGSNPDVAPQAPNGTPTASDQATAPTFSIANGAGQAISSVSWDGSGTVTVLAAGTYAVGQRVVIAGVNTPDQAPDTTVIDGTYVITGLVSGGFTYIDSNPSLNGPDSITPTGATAALASSFDLEDNDLIVHGGNDGSSDFAAVQAAAVTGRNAPIDPSTGLPQVGGFQDGTWTGGGLTSSAAANEVAKQGYEYTALAVVQNSDLPLGQFYSWNVGGISEPLRNDGNDTIVKYTYVGDWALEGAANDDADSIAITSYDNSSVPDNWAHGSYNGGPVNDDAISVFDVDYGNGVSKGGPL